MRIVCEKCSTNPKIDDPGILDQNRGVRLTYDLTLPAELYNIPFTEYTEAVNRTLEQMKVAVYNRAKESYIERGAAAAIHSVDSPTEVE